MTPSSVEPPAPAGPTASDDRGVWRRTLKLALAAFIIGFLLFGPGLGQVHFLLSAYHHGGL